MDDYKGLLQYYHYINFLQIYCSPDATTFKVSNDINHAN